MKIQKIESPSFGNIRVSYAENMHHKYLSNIIMDEFKKVGVGIKYSNKFIEFLADKESIIKKLKDLNINFLKI